LKKFVLILAAFGFCLPAFSAGAQVLCGVRTDMAAKLADKYQEVPNGMGMTNSGGVLEVFSSPKGTWTIMVTMPEKNEEGKLKACLIAHGDAWEKLPPQYATSGEAS